jgi:glycosyltransferase involved in cell wall biosynthesis
MLVLSNNRRHVSMINAHHFLGGAETVMHQISAGLQKENWGYDFVLPTLGKTFITPPRVKVLYPRWLDRLRYTRLRDIVEKRWPSFVIQSENLKRLSKPGNRLFHVHSYTGYASYQALADLAFQRPVLWTLHCYWGDVRLLGQQEVPYPAAWGLAPQLLRQPNCVDELRSLHEELQPLFAAPLWVTTPSAAAADAVKRCPELNGWHVNHVPNGVRNQSFDPDRKLDKSLKASLGLDPDKMVILLINRDFRIVDKGFLMALEALLALPANSATQVLLVGQNAAWAAQQLPKELRPIAYDFVADRASIIRFYEASDIFLFASQRENFPCVTLEAMAAGCCVVATPTDGVTEQICDGIEGLLAKDISGSALAAPLSRAISDTSLRQRLGRRARERVVTKFSEDLMVRRYISLYQEMEEQGK